MVPYQYIYNDFYEPGYINNDPDQLLVHHFYQTKNNNQNQIIAIAILAQQK